MFNRSRRQIILSIMGSLILLFVVTLSVILLASYREIQQKNADMLERYVALYALENQPEEDDSFSTSGGSESEMIDTGAGAPYHDSIPSCP